MKYKKYFELFKKECEYWIDRLQLNNWRIEIYCDEEEKDDRAYLVKNTLGMCADIYLCERFLDDKEEGKEKMVKDSAKHECLHLLLGNFSNMNHSRFVGKIEMEIEEESIVRKLENIIK